MSMRALLLVAILGSASVASADVVKIGDRAPEIEGAKDASGKAFKLKALKGWVVVTVGAEWCKPCAKELPTWDKLAGDAKVSGKVTFVAVDIDESADTGKKFHQRLRITNMKKAYTSGDAPASRYGADTMPTTVVIDPKGVVRLVKKGFEERDSDGEYSKLRDELEKLIAKP